MVAVADHGPPADHIQAHAHYPCVFSIVSTAGRENADRPAHRDMFINLSVDRASASNDCAQAKKRRTKKLGNGFHAFNMINLRSGIKAKKFHFGINSQSDGHHIMRERIRPEFLLVADRARMNGENQPGGRLRARQSRNVWGIDWKTMLQKNPSPVIPQEGPAGIEESHCWRICTR